MKKVAIYRAVFLLVIFMALAATSGCGGGGGGAAATSAPLTITTASLPSGVQGQLYSVSVNASGGTIPHGWSVTGALPPGITLDPATGVLSGTPTAQGTFPLTFTVTDGASATASKSLSLQIDPPAAPVVSTAALPAGNEDVAYSATLSATGGTPPYSWSVPPGTLPPGLDLTAAGLLSGTPTVQGTFEFTITVTDNNSMTGNKPFTIVIGPPVPPVVSTAALPSGKQNEAYSATLAATGGTPPYDWSVSGVLPPGMLLSNTGALSGTPTAQGIFNPTFTVRDANNLEGTRALSIQINPQDAPTIETTALPAAVRTQPYTATLTATGGTPPFSWSATGLPAGIVLSVAGTLSGTPTVEGVFPLVITVEDQAVSSQVTIDLRVEKPLALYVADAGTPSGAVGVFDISNLADGDAAWSRRILGAATTLDNVAGPPAGVSYDAARNILYVARSQGADNGAVLAFNNAGTVNGNTAPSRILETYTITPNIFSLVSPSDVFIDSGNDRLYIADVTSGTDGRVVIQNNASVGPTFLKIIGFLFQPAAISVDVGRNILYVVPSLAPGFVAIDNVTGPSGGNRTILIAGSGLVDVKVDANDTAYAVDFINGWIYVINNVSQKNGPVTPDRTLTGLVNPNSVFPDPANDRLYVSNSEGAGLGYSVVAIENISTANGPVSASRIMSGFGVAAGMTGLYK